MLLAWLFLGITLVREVFLRELGGGGGGVVEHAGVL